jgi:hypothetical protein
MANKATHPLPPFMLFLVAMALCQINQSQILIFRGIFDFQRCVKLLFTSTAEILSYKDLTEKTPFLVLMTAIAQAVCSLFQ